MVNKNKAIISTCFTSREQLANSATGNEGLAGKGEILINQMIEFGWRM